MEILWKELSFGFDGGDDVAVILIRLLAAMFFGAIIGIEREKAGKAAGVRTHMLVTMGTALFVIVSIRWGMTAEGLSRVVQGIVTGIGFIGAGSILKLRDDLEVKGLTTAAGVWMAAAIGVTTGFGAVGLAAVATVLMLITLSLAVAIDKWIKRHHPSAREPERKRSDEKP